MSATLLTPKPTSNSLKFADPYYMQFSLQTKMNLVDGLYKKGPALCDLFNLHIMGKPFGPYEHFSTAVNHVKQLENKGKSHRAQQLRTLLESFAMTLECTLSDVMEWPALMRLKNERDSFSHPFNRAELAAEVGINNKELHGLAGAATLILAVP